MTQTRCQDHFVGIGGTGMSALACLLFEKGEKVSGCDLRANDRTRALENMGVPIEIGHSESHAEGAGRLVISSAVANHNPEVKRAKELGLAVIKRGERLAELSEELKTIAVAGSHGKTTTTCMLREVFLAGGKDPSFLAGASPKGRAQGAWGKDPLLITEADESDGSFLLLHPSHAIVTNCDGDHLDHWGDRAGALKGFLDFIRGTDYNGHLILDGDDAGTRELLPRIDRLYDTAGFSPAADFWGQVIAERLGENTFEFYDRKKYLGTVNLRVNGRHNIKNALMAGGLALRLGFDFETVKKGLENFSGAQRRFAWQQVGGITLVDDYAHHPTEIEAVTGALRELVDGRMIVVFEPHRHSRTALLFEELTKAFDLADMVILTRVFSAGEKENGVTGEMLSDALHKRGRSKVYYIHSCGGLVPFLLSEVQPGDAVLFLGPGGIGEAAAKLREALRERR